MAEEAVADTPPQTIAKPEYVPPQETLKVKAGDKYRDALDKISKGLEPKAEQTVAEPTTADVTPKEIRATVPAEDAPKVEEVKPPEKPASPLDAVTGDTKPEVAKPEEPDELKEFEDDKNANWKKAREVMRRQSDEKKALEAKLAELSKAPKAAPEEVAKLSQEREQLKAQLAEREELLKLTDIRLSEDYRVAAKKRDDSLRKISTKARSYGVDPDTLVSALVLPDSKFKTDQLKAVMAELEPDDKTAIRILIDKFEESNDAVIEFERDAPQKYEEINAKREATMREQQELAIKQLESEYQKVAQSIPNEVVTLRKVPEDIPGAEEWNTGIETAIQEGLRLLKPGAEFKETSDTAIQGRHYPYLLKMFLKEHSELVEARKRLAGFDSGGPDFKGGAKPKTEVKLTPAEKYHKAMETLKSGTPENI